MSDYQDPVPPPTPVPPEPPWDRPAVPTLQATPKGSSFGAVILFICSFLSLLSTGCFGIFAVGINEGGVWVFFAVGALVMGAVTVGFFVAARALQRRAGSR